MITNPKTKKRRTIEVDEEIQSVEKIRFWEAPLVLEKNDTPAHDFTLVPDEKQITLREIDEPMDLDTSNEVRTNFFFNVYLFQYCNFIYKIHVCIHFFKLQNGFGDEGTTFIFDEDEEMESIETEHFEMEQSQTMEISCCASLDMDENMNDIVQPEIDDQMQLETVRKSPTHEFDGAQAQNEADQNQSRHTENPLNVIASLSPLKPLAVTALRQSKGKRRTSIFKDINKIITVEQMHKLIQK